MKVYTLLMLIVQQLHVPKSTSACSLLYILVNDLEHRKGMMQVKPFQGYNPTCLDKYSQVTCKKKTTLIL